MASALTLLCRRSVPDATKSSRTSTEAIPASSIRQSSIPNLACFPQLSFFFSQHTFRPFQLNSPSSTPASLPRRPSPTPPRARTTIPSPPLPSPPPLPTSASPTLPFPLVPPTAFQPLQPPPPKSPPNSLSTTQLRRLPRNRLLHRWPMPLSFSKAVSIRWIWRRSALPAVEHRRQLPWKLLRTSVRLASFRAKL